MCHGQTVLKSRRAFLCTATDFFNGVSGYETIKIGPFSLHSTTLQEKYLERHVMRCSLLTFRPRVTTRCHTFHLCAHPTSSVSLVTHTSVRRGERERTTNEQNLRSTCEHRIAPSQDGRVVADKCRVSKSFLPPESTDVTSGGPGAHFTRENRSSFLHPIVLKSACCDTLCI